MTEDEAKTKWCPMAKVAAIASDENGCHAAVAVNRGAAPVNSDLTSVAEGAACIGSACMAWRSGKDGWRMPNGYVIATDREPASGQGGWVKTGFCGLAGSPQ